MPLVEVPDRRRDANSVKRSDPPEAEDDLLLHPGFMVAAVQPGRQFTVPRRVLLEVRVEQVQLHVPDVYHEDRREDGPVAQGDRHHAGRAVLPQSRLDGRVRPVDLFVDLLLPSFSADVLVEVPCGYMNPTPTNGRPRSLASLHVSPARTPSPPA